MANNYSQFDALMKKLIDGTIDKDNFNGTSLEKFAEHQDVFWDGLLQYLQYESDIAKIQHFGIRESDFNKSEIKKGIAEFINENCDLADDFLDSCLAQTDGHWNESYNAVLKYFNEMYGDTEIDETNIKVSDIVNANAGHSFESNVDIKWVMPWENMDKENYAEVRGNDKIVSVLDNRKYLQFTHLFDKYLRLLMPEYQRDVQVEDLNRNFWVIGQVLTGICSYLFNGESPLNELFDGMLDEITQLWENVLYLWTAFAIVSQYDKFMSIQSIVVPINAERKYIYYQRYDNYDRELNPTKENLENILASIWNSNKFLADNYKNSTVVIIPEIRENSYLENYYAKVIYPGAIVINRRYRMGLGQDENNATNQSIDIPFEDIQFYPFLIDDEMFSIEIKDDCSAAICNQDISSTLWGYTEKNFRYQFFSPFNGNIGSGADKIIAEIRTIFTNAQLTFSDYQHYTFNIDATVYDVPRVLAGEVDNKLCDINITDSTSSITINSNTPTPPPASVKIGKGHYRGENVSWQKIVEPTMSITIEKNWINVPYGENFEALIELVGKDKYNVEQVAKRKLFTSNGASSYTFDNLPSYDIYGEVMHYTATEIQQPEGNWNVVGMNIDINYNSVNKTATFTNTYQA